MRRKIKKDICNILNTLQRAHEQILLQFRKNRPADAQKLLGNCQECAQQIGETIERIEGMGTQAVSILEGYCEQLYQMSQCKNRKEQADWKEKMDASLRLVEKEIKNVLPTSPLKVVFLPYKASMWDCLESVWEAAASDPDCEAFVVPIPYFERDEKGGARRLCYEGEIFPSYVPVMPYEAFSLEAEQPDVIFIHNPYDDGNYVTSVHPDYYSATLKKYTDMLVYIPYFFNGKGPMPETHLNLPAYQTVDKIIVQDEEKAESLVEYVPKEKIVALGSPKVDRLLKLEMKRDEIIETAIAPEWREKIRGKKVILYNVSVTGILHNSKVAMDKIRYVLSRFERREDVVLWWRPHPLIEATLQSMRVDMYEEYMRIKREFVRKGYGILDETGDAGIAAVVADAYLGENSSSLVHYFGVLGKPVLFTAWEILENNRRERDFLNVSTWYEEGNSIFFVPTNRGLGHDLYQMNLLEGTIEKVMTFPGTPDEIWGCFYGIKKVQNKIILAPYNTEDVYIYDFDKKQSIKLVLSDSKDRKMLFDEAVEYKGKVFLLPARYPALVSIDMASLNVFEYKECVESFQRENETEHMFQWAYFVKDEYLYLASMNESRILIFNMEDDSYEIRNIGNYPYGYCRLIHDGKYFWLGAFKTNRIVRWEEESGNTKEYIYPMEQEPSNEWAYYSSMIDCGDEIKICCAFCFDILSLNKITGECIRDKGIQDVLNRLETESIKSEAGFSYVKEWNKKEIILFDSGSNHLIIWNLRTGQYKCFPCRLKPDDLLRIEKRQIEKYWLCRATPYCLKENSITISQFIDYIAGGDMELFKQTYECYQNKTENFAAGIRIFEYIKEDANAKLSFYRE